MNIIYIALLFCGISCVYASESIWRHLGRQVTLLFKPTDDGVPDPIANSSEGQRFKKAVQSNQLITAKDIFDDGSDELKKYCGKYLSV